MSAPPPPATGSRSGRLVVVGILAATAALIAVSVRLRRANAPRSVVLVTIDTLRADRLGAYGMSPSVTPQLDALAARGVVFERAWTTAPLTVPAHATILTGLVPPKHGLRVNRPPAKLPAPADRRFSTLAEVLKERGYATGAFVSASVLRDDDTGLGAGFDLYDEVPRAAQGSLHDAERPGRGKEAVDKALAWTRSASAPVFLWVHLFDPHAPYDAPAGWGAGRDHAADATGYDAEVAYADHCVGLLLAGLAEAGLGDAVVAVVADHGEALGEHGEATHGYLLHEATLRVPMIFAAPHLAPGRRGEPVSLADVLPTLLALAGHAIPPRVNGAPLFGQGTGDLAARPIYAESLYPWHACRWAQAFALRRGDEKLVAAGPRSLAFDLAADPAEDHPSALDAGQREALARAIDVARQPALGAMTAAASTAPSGPYWSVGSGGATPVLSDEENARLASPYDRMDVLAKFDDACGAVAEGRGEAALAAFDDILRTDPGNLQAAFWRGRALESLRRFGEAAAAYRAAFEIGFRSPACVAKALHCAVKALIDPDAAAAGAEAEWRSAVGFLADARGKGCPDDASTYLFEAALHLDAAHADPDRASAALDLAEKAPGADAVRAGIAQTRQLLDALPK